MSTPARWAPDAALVVAVRSRSVRVSSLPDPDRSWVVASLTVEGWTVAAIADRLCCSLRLVQQIKAQPMTRIAEFALGVEQSLRQERAIRHLEARTAAHAASRQEQQIARLMTQRDNLLDHIRALPKDDK